MEHTANRSNCDKREEGVGNSHFIRLDSRKIAKIEQNEKRKTLIRTS